jgi:hypothetical protein
LRSTAAAAQESFAQAALHEDVPGVICGQAKSSIVAIDSM